MPLVTADAEVSRDDVVWSFGPSMTPVLTVAPGAVIRVETNDCFHGQVTSEDITADKIDMGRVNSATGPIWSV